MASRFTRHDPKVERQYGGKSGGGKHAKTKGGHVKWSEATPQPVLKKAGGK